MRLMKATIRAVVQPNMMMPVAASKEARIRQRSSTTTSPYPSVVKVTVEK
jgi:hypothetical protein